MAKVAGEVKQWNKANGEVAPQKNIVYYRSVTEMDWKIDSEIHGNQNKEVGTFC